MSSSETKASPFLDFGRTALGYDASLQAQPLPRQLRALERSAHAHLPGVRAAGNAIERQGIKCNDGESFVIRM